MAVAPCEGKIIVLDRDAKGNPITRDPTANELDHLQAIAKDPRRCSQPLAERVLKEGGAFSPCGIMYIGNDGH